MTTNDNSLTQGDTTALRDARVQDFGHGAVTGIKINVPGVPTTAAELVVDQAKNTAIDAMVNSAQNGDHQASSQSAEQQKPSFWNQVASYFKSAPPPPPPPQPPPPPPQPDVEKPNRD